VTGRKIDNIS